jgi:membrane protease YdiL (CAAX protease family)
MLQRLRRLGATESGTGAACSAPAETPPLVPRTQRCLYLAVEFAALFVGLPVFLFTQRHALTGMIAPVLLVLAAGCTALLWWDQAFDRSQLWNRSAFRRHVERTLRWFVPGAGLVIVAFAVLRPDLLMSFPHVHTNVWLAIMVTYPVVSVYPQEVIFRAFLFHRYDALFPGRRAKIVASGAAFGVAHIVFANWTAPLMTTVIGVQFARTYAKSESTLQAALEHVLWGSFAFTVGLGWYVYSGAI